MQRSKKHLVVAAATAAIAQVALSTFTAQAATFTWDGGGNANLSNGLNWVGDVAPNVAGGDVAIMTGNVNTSPTADQALTYLSITFDALADAFTLGGSNTITLGAAPSTAGTIINNSALAQTFNAPVTFFAGTINTVAGDITFNGPLNIGNGGTVSANALNVNGTFTTTLNGALTSVINDGSTALNKVGPGTLIINGDNSAFTGNGTIGGGAVRINNGNGLGSGAGTIFLAAAAAGGGSGVGALELTGGITVAKNVQMNGRDNANFAHVRSVSGSNTISNLFGVTGGAFHVMEAASGSTLTISSYTLPAVVGSARTIAMQGDGSGQINSWSPANVAIAHNVVKNGAGQWTLGSGMNNTGSFGNLTVNGGTLVLGSGLGARVTGNATINSGATLVVQASGGEEGEISNFTTPRTVSVLSGGTLDASSFTTYSLQIGQTLVLGGTMKAGTLVAFGDTPVRLGNSGAAGSIGTGTVVGNFSISREFDTAGGGIHFDLANATTIGGGVNDLLSIQGDLQVNNGSGSININVNPVNASLATGTYRLIEFTSGNTPNAADFNLLGFTPGQTRQTVNITTAVNQVNLTVSGSAASIVWKGNGAGNEWDIVTTQNWTNGGVDDFFYTGDAVTFNDTTANTTVNLANATFITGGITVAGNQGYLLQGSGTLGGNAPLVKSGLGTFTIANTGTNSLGPVTIHGGTLQIGNGGADGSLGSATITVNANLVVDKSGGLTLGQVIEGTGGIWKRGTGALALTGTNTFSGGVFIQGGAIQYNNSSALGSDTTGTAVSSGAQLFSTANTTTTEPLSLAGDGPVAGDGALRSGGATTSTFNGPIMLTGDTTLKVDGGATMLIGGGLSGTATNLTLNADAGGNGLLASTVSLGTGGIIKNGPGTWTLANANITYSGATTVNAGVLQYGTGVPANDATLPTAPLTISNGTTISFNNSGSYAVSATISGGGSANLAVGSGGGTVTFTGDLTGFTGLLTTSHVGTISTMIVPVATNAVGVRISDVNLNNSTTGRGIIRITNSNAINNSGVATLDIQAAQDIGVGRLELGNSASLNFASIILHPRNNLTPTILALDGSNTIAGPMRVNTGGTTVNFQAAAGANLTFTGLIRPAQTGEGDVPGSSRALLLSGDGNGTMSGNITNRPDAATTVGIMVVKSGAGTWRLTGNNDYIGAATNAALPANAATIVQAGTLALVGAGAHTPVLNNPNTNAYTDVQGGRLVLDYTGGSSPAAQVATVLDAGFDQTPRFSAGIIRSTTVTNLIGLGWREDTGAQTVTIARTYYGDADLNGQVDVNDLGTLATNWQALQSWGGGDFDYDGSVGVNDLGLVATNWQAGVGNPLGPSFADAAAALGLPGVAVPEPASMGLLGIAAWSLRRRRR
jgi:autotransporter-associated beta strand protein